MNLFDDLIKKISLRMILTMKGMKHGELTEAEVKLLEETDLSQFSYKPVSRHVSTEENRKKLNAFSAKEYTFDIAGQLAYINDFNDLYINIDEPDGFKIRAFIRQYLEHFGYHFHLVTPLNIKATLLMLVSFDIDPNWKQPADLDELKTRLKESKVGLTFVLEVIKNIEAVTLLMKFLEFIFQPENLEGLFKISEDGSGYTINNLRNLRDDIIPESNKERELRFLDYRDVMSIKVVDEMIYKLEEKV